ncbi:MAG: NlpC/P60 family protein [Bacteroidetes bacterium]|nr:MAG: NlpC/P60 family protein [Bacteroidota bacterium]
MTIKFNSIQLTLVIFWLLLFPSCPPKEFVEPATETEAVINNVVPNDTVAISHDTVITPPPSVTIIPYSSHPINTGSTTPKELLAYANTLIGIPYKYASTDPSIGFDCSGFITYVFNHFKIAVPRSSIDFTNVEREIKPGDAKPGDIVLFTGTDTTTRDVGHMGILTSTENGDYYFIHSTSGKANGVTISPLNKYYAVRFVKIIRIFPQNDIDL